MKAIVYTSRTGFTREYALMLSQALSLPAYDLKTAKKNLASGSEIIYLGWVMGDGVKGLRAAGAYRVKAVCAVGMSVPSDEGLARIKKLNNLACPLFQLRGGLDLTRQTGIYKLMLGMVRASLKKKRDSGQSLSVGDAQALALFEQGGSAVSAEALEPVLAWAGAAGFGGQA